MDCLQLLGFLAAFLMFSTFYMKEHDPPQNHRHGKQRDIYYLYNQCRDMAGVCPACRSAADEFFSVLIQMLKLIKKVRSASEDDMSFEFMIPHMHKEKFNKDEVVFHRGDIADKIYILRSGILTLDELDVVIRPGEIFGEMGVFASEPVRLATLRCGSEVELLSMTDTQIKQLYYQNPQFGFYLIQLLLKRFSQNEGHGEKNNIDYIVPEERRI